MAIDKTEVKILGGLMAFCVVVGSSRFDNARVDCEAGGQRLDGAQSTFIFGKWPLATYFNYEVTKDGARSHMLRHGSLVNVRNNAAVGKEIAETFCATGTLPEPRFENYTLKL